MAGALTVEAKPIPLAAWRMLALGVSAQAAGSIFLSTPAYLIPLLHNERGLSLSRAGLLSSAATLGMVLTLVLWGAMADRYGERWVISGGLALTGCCAIVASFIDPLLGLGILLVAGGASAASTSAASGRVVVGWFPRSHRGLAMGIRQTSQPLGVAIAALIVPTLADRSGIGAPLLFSGIVLAVLALLCAIGIVNPPRSPVAAASADAARNPYRGDTFLARIHVISLLLVVPQFALATFGLVWLTNSLGWSASAAGVVIATAQFVGAFGRIAIGVLSDRVGSRVRVLRWVALSGVISMSAVALSGALRWDIAAGVLLVVATAISVADNGLAFMSVAEAAGPGWSGKALGLQNTGQYIAATAVGPAIGALIGVSGYAAAFALVAITPLLSTPLVPKRDQHWDES